MLIERVFDVNPGRRSPAPGGSLPWHDRPVPGRITIDDETRSRLRCTQCGNLTRFDVVETRRTRAYYHFSLAGELSVEDEEVLSARREAVTCRWCGSSEVEEVPAP